MSSIARHHAEWLSLLEISGPFLLLPVLLRVFPQGLDEDDPDHRRELRLAYEEWLDNQFGLQPDLAIHHAWVRYVLAQILQLPDEVLAEGQAIPKDLKATIAEQQETLRPALVILDPDGLRQDAKALRKEENFAFLAALRENKDYNPFTERMLCVRYKF